MNRPGFFLTLLMLALLAGGCREDKQMPKGSRVGMPDSFEVTKSDPTADSLRIDSLFETVRLLQAAVMEKPSEKRRVDTLCAKSLDTVAGCFYLVGTGIKKADLPDEAQTLARKTAAAYSARQWALFLKARYSGEKIAFGTPITGDVLYQKELRTRAIDDTLFVFFMVPVGSVVVKKLSL